MKSDALIREPEISNRAGQRGFSIMTAIFLVVVLGLLGVFIVFVTGLQQSSQQIDLQGVRAYQAARAGVEWAAFQVLDPNNSLNSASCSALPSCPGGGSGTTTTLPTLAGSLSPFAVGVKCDETSTTEGNRQVKVFKIVSTASTGTPGTAGYVNREVQATMSKCLDPTAAAPRCSCS
jgi:MSHA biogenesis protein MshP